jgi:ParB family chromosome partitioning protein
MTKTTKKKELGAGIRALLGDINMDSNAINAENDVRSSNYISEIPIQYIEVNPFQPRLDFDEERLQELAESISVHGVIQPITVRRLAPDQYQLIAGERRLRASKIAGLSDIPAYIRQADDQAMLEIALIENIQREDLNPMEIAQNYQRLIEECSITHDDLGKRLGKNRSTVTNFLRLLKLPPDIQVALKNQTISMGHARALITLTTVEQQLTIYKAIIERALSVRQVEEMVRQMAKTPKTTPNAGIDGIRMPIHFRKIQENLAAHFGTVVNLKRNNKGKGELVIPFGSDSELNRILTLIKQ